jgi:hypothetical protein
MDHLYGRRAGVLLVILKKGIEFMGYIHRAKMDQALGLK